MYVEALFEGHPGDRNIVAHAPHTSGMEIACGKDVPPKRLYGSRAVAALLCFAAFVGGCSSDGEDAQLAKPSGPSRVDLAAVQKHATQFDTKLPLRPAGSQEEEIATSYLLAHMQQAGYLVRLDGVPVQDQVRSTNVVAPPPSGELPTEALVVAYDTPPEGPSNGETLGLWLELARALNVKDPQHTVEFVALGADHAELPGAPLGQRRLARFFTDEGLKPSIVMIEPGEEVSLAGPAAPVLAALFPKGTRPDALKTDCPESGCEGPLEASGFVVSTMSGPAPVIGSILLRYLSEAHS